MKDFTSIHLIRARLLSSSRLSLSGFADWISAYARRLVVKSLASFSGLFPGSRTGRASDSQKQLIVQPDNGEADANDRNLKLLEISVYLREPVLITARALNKNIQFLQKVEYLRNHRQSETAIKRHVAGFRIPQQPEFEALQKYDPRSRIVASFHFGDFIYGVHKLMCLQQDVGKTLVLSQKQSTPAYLNNMALGFGDKAATAGNQLLRDQIGVREMASFLRLPKSTLVMFADLPSGYGSTVETQFLGRKACFSKGIALLALTCHTPILPVICFKSNREHQILLGKQIEPSALQGESRQQTIARITQQQIHFFEYFFKLHYEQWRYLQHLPDYFTKGNS